MKLSYTHTLKHKQTRKQLKYVAYLTKHTSDKLQSFPGEMKKKR